MADETDSEKLERIQAMSKESALAEMHAKYMGAIAANEEWHEEVLALRDQLAAVTKERDEAVALVRDVTLGCICHVLIDGAKCWACRARAFLTRLPQAGESETEAGDATVERVARAIFAADRLHNDGGATTWDGLARDFHELLRGNARAAIAAMASSTTPGETERVEPECLRPMTEEQRATFKPLTEEQIQRALEEGQRDVDIATGRIQAPSLAAGDIGPRCPLCSCVLGLLKTEGGCIETCSAACKRNGMFFCAEASSTTPGERVEGERPANPSNAMKGSP